MPQAHFVGFPGNHDMTVSSGYGPYGSSTTTTPSFGQYGQFGMSGLTSPGISNCDVPSSSTSVSTSAYVTEQSS